MALSLDEICLGGTTLDPIVIIEPLGNRCKTSAVPTGGAQIGQCIHMLSRSITFVFCKTITWKFSIDRFTPFITLHLAQYGCRRNTGNFGVTLDDCFGQNIQNRDAVSVNQYLARLQTQTLGGAPIRFPCWVQARLTNAHAIPARATTRPRPSPERYVLPYRQP